MELKPEGLILLADRGLLLQDLKEDEWN